MCVLHTVPIRLNPSTLQLASPHSRACRQSCCSRTFVSREVEALLYSMPATAYGTMRTSSCHMVLRATGQRGGGGMT